MHNFRGAGISGGDGSDHIRVFVWARVSVVGAKDPGDFVMAALELSGQILVYESDKYNVITEDDIISRFSKENHTKIPTRNHIDKNPNYSNHSLMTNL